MLECETSASPRLLKRRRRPARVNMPRYGIYVLESHHAATFKMPMSDWPFHKLCWVSIGSGVLEFVNERILIKRDDLIILPAGLFHSFVDKPKDPLTLVICCFNDQMLLSHHQLRDLYQLLTQQSSEHPIFRAANAYTRSEVREAFRSLLREQNQQQPGFVPAMVANLATLLVQVHRGCSQAIIEDKKHEREMNGIIAYLDVNFHKPIKVGDMASLCGVSRRRFSDLFKEHTGLTLIDYVNKKRIAYAIERLLETGHISYACHEAGFEELGYFYRVFKRYTSLTPKQFITKAKEV